MVTPDGDARTAACVYLEARPELQVICVAENGRTALRYYTTSSRVAGSESLETSETSARIVEESLAELDVNRLVQAIRRARRAG